MTHKSPFFSVVIPTYNRADFILNTLDTVFEQTFQDFEVIVVDNCSTDNTLEILQPLIDENKIRFIQHDKNYERAKSRNTGMKNAKGEYLTFLDSDDFMYPNNLKDAYEYVEANPEKKVFHNLYELVNEQKEKVYDYNFQKLKNPLKQIAEGNFLSCIGVFIHREVYTTVFWDETPELTGSEDYEFWLRVLGNFPDLGRIEKVNNGILDHAQRTINQIQIDKAKTRFDYFLKKIDTEEVFNKFGKLKGKIKATLYVFLAGMAKEIGDFKMMRENMKLAKQSDSGIWKRRNYQSLWYNYLKKKVLK